MPLSLPRAGTQQKNLNPFAKKLNNNSVMLPLCAEQKIMKLINQL
jgi:hypothetical protein